MRKIIAVIAIAAALVLSGVSGTTFVTGFGPGHVWADDDGGE